MTAALQAVGLSRRFGGLLAVADVSLELEVGELHAVIGPNGAGKSTLVNLLSGELPPSSGVILVAGVDVTGWSNARIARAGIGRSFQRTNLMPALTVLETVRLAAQARVPLRRVWRRAVRDAGPLHDAYAALARVGLTAVADSVSGTLSHGQLRQLEIAVALAAQPKVLLLDEPLAGMGPEESETMASLLRELARDHAVLLVEHDMDVVFAVADRMTVMVDGRVLEQGTPETIRASASVRDAYLGQSV
jgi:branched-chain amino acid transport system ATP-binding protein